MIKCLYFKYFIKKQTTLFNSILNQCEIHGDIYNLIIFNLYRIANPTDSRFHYFVWDYKTSYFVPENGTNNPISIFFYIHIHKRLKKKRQKYLFSITDFITAALVQGDRNFQKKEKFRNLTHYMKWKTKLNI